MQTGQVSVWVPIAVGIIGMIGVIAGQLVNAWREDRRWKQELQREETRWEREREKELAKLAHDTMIDWRERRLRIYGEYLASTAEICTTVGYLADRCADYETAFSLLEKWREQLRENIEIEERVHLVASNAIVDAIHERSSGLMHLIVAKFNFGNSGKDPERLEQMRKMARDHRQEILDLLDELMALMRNELGTNPGLNNSPDLRG